METFSKIVEGTKSGWNSMDRKKKIIMVGLVVGIILIALLLSYFSRQVTYATLFTNLEPEDAGTIVEDLKSKNMKYKLENGGRDILIDEKHVDSYRLQLAMEGNMPEKSSGFEIFDNMGLMVTDEDRKIMYQRALAGELQRSIMSLDAVNYAKVHLVMSEKSIFETEEKEASASVFLDLNPGKKITDNMIRGIAALVSGAVDNLPEENIKIIDSKGNLLSNILEEGDDLGAINALDQYQKARESFQ
ncbi:MAG TPA: flagellar basal-body MS-ring/collar protein FliF, partial [Tissierellaceae bacterium]|nr:flagellar basal-body MS-ring/collar protein FliF [Tissierellaceae bacterium]